MLVHCTIGAAGRAGAGSSTSICCMERTLAPPLERMAGGALRWVGSHESTATQLRDELNRHGADAVGRLRIE